MSARIPESWVECTFGELNQFNSRTIDPAQFPNEEFELYSVPSFPVGKPEYLKGAAIGSTKQTVSPNDVLVCKINPRINRVWQVNSAQQFRQIASSEWIGFRNDELNAKFYRYYFTSAYFRALICTDVTGVGGSLTRAQPKKVATFPVPVAPLNEQKRIADKLDAILARVDACREHLDRVPVILKRFRQSVLVAATTGKLTEDWREKFPQRVDAQHNADLIHAAHEEAGGHKAGNAAAPTEDVHDLSVDMFPKGWALATMRDVVIPDRPITYGILKPGPELSEGVPYVRVADFPGEKLNLASIRKTSPEVDEDFKRSRLRPGDLLLSIRGTVGRLVVIPDELAGANITQDSARLSVQSAVNRDYVLWYLRSSMAQDRMKGSTKGVAVRGINIGDVRALQLPLPSREEQDEIVRRVESIFAYADRLESRYTGARSQVEKLTPATLAKAFRGELVQQDSNDEPAAALLRRLAEGSAAGSHTKRTLEKRDSARDTSAVFIAQSKKGTMKKQSLVKIEDIRPSHLANILSTAKSQDAKALWTASGLSIDDFYVQLNREISAGLLRVSADDESRLELVIPLVPRGMNAH